MNIWGLKKRMKKIRYHLRRYKNRKRLDKRSMIKVKFLESRIRSLKAQIKLKRKGKNHG